MNPTVYRHYDKFGNLLYVGCTTDPETRLSGHKSVSSWYKQIAKIEMEHFDTRQQALAEEERQIKALSPLHNSRPRPDFVTVKLKLCWSDYSEFQRIARTDATAASDEIYYALHEFAIEQKRKRVRKALKRWGIKNICERLARPGRFGIGIAKHFLDQQTATTPELEKIVWQEAQKYEASFGK